MGDYKDMTANADLLTKSKYDLVLDDGTNEPMGLKFCDANGQLQPLQLLHSALPQSGIQMYRGSPEYTDEHPPIFPVQMDDWSQGRGVASYYRNTNGYYDGEAAWTAKEGELIAGGFPFYMRGLHTCNYETWDLVDRTGNLGYPMNYAVHTLDANGFATEFRASGTYTADTYTLSIVLRYWGTPTNDATIKIVNSSNTGASGGYPTGAVVDTFTVATTDMDTQGMYKTLEFTPDTGLTSGQYYFVLVTSSGSTATNGWQILLSYAGNGVSLDHNGAAWLASTSDIMFRLDAIDVDFKGHFFNYKGAEFVVKEFNDGSRSRLFINGDWGVCTGSSSTTTLKDTSKSWTADEWIGCIVKINYGTGTNQVQRWRLITDNTTDTLTVSPAWGETPVANDTEYSILGSNKWTEIATTANPPDWDDDSLIVSSVHVCNGIVYYCHGDNAPMTSMSYYNNSGTWTPNWVDENENFGYLVDAVDQNGAFLVGVKLGVPSSYAICDTPINGYTTPHTAATFGDDQYDWDIHDRAQNLVVYGDYGNVWAFTERGGAWQMIDRKFYRTSPAEMSNTPDDVNGEAVMRKGVYLYWTYKSSVARYYSNSLDGQNPNKSEYGLPEDRRGYVSAMIAYEGLEIYAYDAGVTGYSSILANNGFGYFELFRAPQVGQRIFGMTVHSIPGIYNVDRLVFSCGQDIIYIPIDADPYNCRKSTLYHFYPFIWEANLITAWVYLKRRGAEKLWTDLQAIVENLGGTFFVDVYYRVDDNTSWTFYTTKDTSFERPYNSSAEEAVVPFSLSWGIEGLRIQIMFSIKTVDAQYSPKIVAGIIRALSKLPTSNRYTFNVLIEDDAVDKEGNPDVDYPTAAGKISVIEDWHDSPVALYVLSTTPFLREKYFVLERQRIDHLQLIDKGKYVMTITLIQLTRA